MGTIVSPLTLSLSREGRGDLDTHMIHLKGEGKEWVETLPLSKE